jgi:hypothetical protein
MMCLTFATAKATAAAPSSTRTGLLVSRRFVRLGSPFVVAFACFATREAAATGCADPDFLAACFVVGLRVLADFLCFVLMHAVRATIVPSQRACALPT